MQRLFPQTNVWEKLKGFNLCFLATCRFFRFVLNLNTNLNKHYNYYHYDCFSQQQGNLMTWTRVCITNVMIL